MPLSSRQCEYLALAWQCFENEPKIDYEKFREVAGLASAASARELMRTTKKKLREEYGALGASVRAGKTPSAKATPQKKTAAANGSGTPSTAGKKRGRTPASASAKKSGNGLMSGLGMVGGGEDGEGEDDEEEIEYEMKSPSKKRAKVNGDGKAAKKAIATTTINDTDDDDDTCEKDSEAAAGAETWDSVRVKAEPKPSDFGLDDAPGGGWFSP